MRTEGIRNWSLLGSSRARNVAEYPWGRVVDMHHRQSRLVHAGRLGEPKKRSQFIAMTGRRSLRTYSASEGNGPYGINIPVAEGHRAPYVERERSTHRTELVNGSATMGAIFTKIQ